METLEYLGPAGAPPSSGRGLRTVYDTRCGRRTHETDVVIGATGADPMAPTGIQSVLGSQLYNSLVLVLGHDKGLVAATPDKSVIVTTTPLSTDGKWRKLIEKSMYPSVDVQNRVAAGIAIARLSGEAAAELLQEQ